MKDLCFSWTPDLLYIKNEYKNMLLKIARKKKFLVKKKLKLNDLVFYEPKTFFNEYLRRCDFFIKIYDLELCNN